MREYQVTEVGKLAIALLHAGGVAAALFATALGIGPIAMAIVERMPTTNPSGMATLSCFGLWCLGIGWTVALGLINVYPTIWTDEEGIVISAFIWARVAVPWGEIVDVGAGHVPFGHTLVRAHHITPFHRLYGWFYSRTLYPSFVINRSIKDRDELLVEIRLRTRQDP